jgi:gliding motility-associated-like protein
MITPLKLDMKINVTDVACWGEATGRFWHGGIQGGSGSFTAASWTVWDNTKQIFVDSNVINRVGSGIDFKNQKAGVYAFYAKDSKDCEIFDTIYIKEPDPLQFFSTHKNTTCSKSNGLIAFEAKGGAVPYSYSLVMPDGSVKAPSSRKDTLFNLPTGIYTLKVIDNNKCEINDVKVEILASPFPTLIVDTIIAARCGKDNGSIELKAYYITGKDTAYAPGPYTYVWTPKKNSTGNILDANIIGMLKAGNYQLHFKDGNNCEIDTAFTVGNFPSPTLSYLVQPETCGRKDGTITLTVESASPDSLTYQWEGLSEKSNEATHLKAEIYNVKIRDLSCEIDTNIILKHIDGPTADFVASTYTVPVKGIFTLTDNSQGTPKMWNWSMGDGSSSQTGKVVRHSYQDTGVYHVFMEVTDANNCKDTISKPIRVYNELQVFIPNTFSPNGDKLNDTWKPILSESLKDGYQLTIYDRWGENVFHTTDPNAAWDGNIKGKPAQSNTVYSYRLTVKDLLGKELEYTGFVTLIR